MNPKRWLLTTLAVFVLAAGSARAQDRLAQDPSSRVARLNYLSGDVSFRPASLDDWAPATLNFPLTTGDHLWTEEGGRTELHVGSTALRLGSGTAFSILNLDDQTLQMRLSEGTLSLRVRHLEEDEVIEVDTPNASVSVVRPGLYRIDVERDGEKSTITVRQGEATVASAGSEFSVRSDESAIVDGLDSPTYDVRGARRDDRWDDWCLDRDRREDRSTSTRYVSRELGGYEDLDTYGSWREGGEYGAVWVPSGIERGWAPYRYGHWAWIAPWGWTWIDDAPWGFAPFHYGRWVYVDGYWGWVPGTIVARPCYAPALVVFVGGDGWGLSSQRAVDVAWFPLGPREVYVPPYTVSEVYVRNVNITHVRVTTIDVTNVRYVNRSVVGAITAVPRDVMIQARPVRSAAVDVSVREMASVRVSSKPPSLVQPRAESVVGALARGAAVRRPPSRVEERRVIVRATPPAPPSAPWRARGDEGPRARVLIQPAAPKGEGPKLRPARPELRGARPTEPGAAKKGAPLSSEPVTGGPSAQPTPLPKGEGGKKERLDREGEDRKKDRERPDSFQPTPRPREVVEPTPKPERQRATPEPERPRATPEPERHKRGDDEMRPEKQREKPPERERETPKEKEREKAPDKEKEKPKPRPTPTPTPTPTPKPHD